MNKVAFLRGFFSRLEKLGFKIDPQMGRVFTTTPGREIFAPKRSEFSVGTGRHPDPSLTARASKLRARGVKGDIPTSERGLKSWEEMSQMFSSKTPSGGR